MGLRRLGVLLILISTAAASEPLASLDRASPVEISVEPGRESGRIDGGDRASPLRVLGRAVLFVPRIAAMIALAPVRAGLLVYDRYDIEPRLVRLFFDDEEIVGLYPTAELDTDYGLNIGARFVHRDLFGAREHLSVRAGTGGRYRRVGLVVRTGDRLGERVAIEIAGDLEDRFKDRFYGIGNLDDAPEARHQQQLARARGTLDVRTVRDLHLRAAAAISDIGYDRSEDGPPIDLLYGEQMLTGWTGVRQLYGELELRWDDRGRGQRWDPPKVLATGTLASAFVGRAFELEAGGDFWRYGVDLQRFLRIGAGPRVVSVRLHGEGVTGSVDEVPFTELPQLGGKVLLRGYPTDRFRDRIATVGTLEYRWGLSYRITGSAFVDVGRVYPSLSELAIEDMRVGYGVGLEYQTRSHFIGQLSIASSIDGGVFLNVTFDPVFDADPRVVRR